MNLQILQVMDVSFEIVVYPSVDECSRPLAASLLGTYFVLFEFVVWNSTMRPREV